VRPVRRRLLKTDCLPDREIPMRSFALLLAVAATPVWLAAQPSAAPASPRSVLHRTVAEVRFDSAPLESVLDWFAEASAQNVVVQWEMLADFGIERDEPVTLRLRNVQFETVLWLVLNQVAGPDIPLAYEADREFILISTAQALGQRMIVRVYDVADLLLRVPHFRNAYRLDLSSAGSDAGSGRLERGDYRDEDPRPAADGGYGTMPPLVNVIQETIEPDSWRANGGLGTIMPFGAKLVVRNTIGVHQQLGGGNAP